MEPKKVILLIDDDPDILRSLKVVLGNEGFSVLTAMSGQDGITEATTFNPDLIICDMMMERIDSGMKVASELRSKNQTVPIFLFSSIGDATASNIDINQLGFDGVFQKPVNLQQLVTTIQQILKK